MNQVNKHKHSRYDIFIGAQSLAIRINILVTQYREVEKTYSKYVKVAYISYYIYLSFIIVIVCTFVRLNFRFSKRTWCQRTKETFPLLVFSRIIFVVYKGNTMKLIYQGNNFTIY